MTQRSQAAAALPYDGDVSHLFSQVLASSILTHLPKAGWGEEKKKGRKSKSALRFQLGYIVGQLDANRLAGTVVGPAGGQQKQRGKSGSRIEHVQPWGETGGRLSAVWPWGSIRPTLFALEVTGASRVQWWSWGVPGASGVR